MLACYDNVAVLPRAGNLEGAGLGADEVPLICCGNARRVFLKES